MQALRIYFMFFALGFFSVQTEAQIVPIGLQGKSVPDLGVYGGFLYAVTDSEGVFQYEIFQPSPGWKSLGLSGKRLRSVYPHKSGPLGFAVTVGAEPRGIGGDTTLAYCSFMANGQWEATDNGMDRTEIFKIAGMDGFPDPTICGETFAVGNGKVYRRGFIHGSAWTKVFDIGIGSINVVKADLRVNQVWIGGETAIFAPFLAKSTNTGTSWRIFLPNLGGNNACNSIAIHPQDPNIIYAGMEGAVIKTTDGGESWKTTGLQGTPFYFYGLGIDPSNPDHLYAGGTPAGNTFALFETVDGGTTWRQIFSPAPRRGISNLVVDPSDGNTIYIATLGDGVFRYRSLVTLVDHELNIPQEFVLFQNYPNPFNPVTRIRYQIPTDSYVTLEIFNLLGEVIATPVARYERKGSYEVHFDGSAIPSGSYFYRLSAGGFIRSLRMLLLK